MADPPEFVPVPVDPGDMPAVSPRLNRQSGTNRKWGPILIRGAAIVKEYRTAVTLRQLHYRLVAEQTGGYRNDKNSYNYLSRITAEARREGTFPPLSDMTRTIQSDSYYDSPQDAVESLVDGYSLDRSRDQPYRIVVLYEKATLSNLIESWTFGRGIPTAALRGYSSASLERELIWFLERDGRPVVVFYVGDLDPEGEDIERNMRDQLDRLGIECAHWQRLAVNYDQIAEYGLVENYGKPGSTRAEGFERKYKRLFQIETEAIAPDVLAGLVRDAIADERWWDQAAYDSVMEDEESDRERLREFSETFDDDDSQDSG